jgi:hypothetical protein
MATLGVPSKDLEKGLEEKGRKRKAYLMEVADLFGISEVIPFGGKFFYEEQA